MIRALSRDALFVLCCLFIVHARGATGTSLWEFGAGLGAIHYEHYPSSNQFTNLILPFPTFQYRGEILRADDREGTRAYLFREDDTTIEIAGALLPALNANDDEARRGMDDLPWMGEVGPQLVHRFNPGWEMRLALFQAAGSDLHAVRTYGQVGELKIIHRWESVHDAWLGLEAGPVFSEVSFQLQTATQEFLSTYFEVPRDRATEVRPAYAARSGFLDTELTLFERFRSGRANFYFGAAVTDYSLSVNRESPLHRSDRNLTGLVGVTYVLGESARRSVPEDETDGIINHLRDREREREREKMR